MRFAAQVPIRLGDLAGKLATNFPDRPDSMINEMLAELVTQRILISSLHPPMTSTDPLGFIYIENLAYAQSPTVPVDGALRPKAAASAAQLKGTPRW